MKALLGDYPVTKYLKESASQHSWLEFADVKLPQ